MSQFGYNKINAPINQLFVNNPIINTQGKKDINPPGNPYFLITEGGDNILTESELLIYTEQAQP